MADLRTRHVVSVVCLEARNLTETQTFGKQDPYVTVQCVGTTQKSWVHHDGGTKANWGGFTMSFDVQAANVKVDSLYINVKNSNSVSDSLIGFCKVPLLQFASGGRSDQWYTLRSSGKSRGEVRLGIQITPPAPHVAPAGTSSGVGAVAVPLRPATPGYGAGSAGSGAGAGSAGAPPPYGAPALPPAYPAAAGSSIRSGGAPAYPGAPSTAYPATPAYGGYPSAAAAPTYPSAPSAPPSYGYGTGGYGGAAAPPPYTAPSARAPAYPTAARGSVAPPVPYSAPTSGYGSALAASRYPAAAPAPTPALPPGYGGGGTSAYPSAGTAFRGSSGVAAPPPYGGRSAPAYGASIGGAAPAGPPPPYGYSPSSSTPAAAAPGRRGSVGLADAGRMAFAAGMAVDTEEQRELLRKAAEAHSREQEDLRLAMELARSERAEAWDRDGDGMVTVDEWRRTEAERQARIAADEEYARKLARGEA